MNQTEKITTDKGRRFLLIFISILITTNLIGLAWALNPSSIGLYVLWFVIFPINCLLLVIGLLRTVLFQLKKIELNYFVYYATVVLLPILITLLSEFLIRSFANNKGC